MSDILQTVSKVKDSLFANSFGLLSNNSRKESFAFDSLSFKDTLQQECGKGDNLYGSAFSRQGILEKDSSDNSGKDSFSAIKNNSDDSRDAAKTAEIHRDNLESKSNKKERIEDDDEKAVVEGRADNSSEEDAVKEKSAEKSKDSEDKKVSDKEEDKGEKVAEEKDGEDKESKKAAKDSENSEKAAKDSEKNSKNAEKVADVEDKEEKALDLGKELENEALKNAETKGKEEKASSVAKIQAAKDEAEAVNSKIQEAVKNIKALQKEVKSDSKELGEAIKNGNNSLTENVMKNIANSKQNSDKNHLTDSKKKLADSQAGKFSELGKEADVKVKKMTFENNNASGNSNSDPKELLRTLLNKARQNIAKEDNAGDPQLETQKGVELKETRNIFGEIIKNHTEAGALLKDTPTKADLFKSGMQKIFAENAKTSNPVNSKSVSSSQHVVMENIAGRGAARMMMQGAIQTAPSGTSANVTLVQELMARMQGMLRGSNLDSGSKLSMDFEAGKWGEMSMTMQHKNGSLSVSLQVGNDASREQLMNQRDEMEQHLRQMGYKEVVFDVTGKGSENQHDERQKKQQKQGNESIENVKLAGNDKDDMAQVLSGAFMN